MLSTEENNKLLSVFFNWQHRKVIPKYNNGIVRGGNNNNNNNNKNTIMWGILQEQKKIFCSKLMLEEQHTTQNLEDFLCLSIQSKNDMNEFETSIDELILR